VFRTGSLDDLMYRNAIRALRLERDPYFASMLEGRRVFRRPARFRARVALLTKYGLVRPMRRLLRREKAAGRVGG
jgi:hypothetical protein